jgi:membrane-bound inhibitor of C-type lysozyme
MGVGAVRAVLLVGLAATSAACVHDMRIQTMPTQAQYVCEDGKTFTVEFVSDPPSAKVSTGGSELTLPQTIGATDAKYTDGQTTLYVEGNRALLETMGQVFGRGCVQR